MCGGLFNQVRIASWTVVLAVGDVLSDFLVPVAPFLDAFRDVGAVAPFVAEVVVLGHVASMIARGLGELGIGTERRQLGLGPDSIVGFNHGRENRIQRLVLVALPLGQERPEESSSKPPSTRGESWKRAAWFIPLTDPEKFLYRSDFNGDQAALHLEV